MYTYFVKNAAVFLLFSMLPLNIEGDGET